MKRLMIVGILLWSAHSLSPLGLAQTQEAESPVVSQTPSAYTQEPFLEEALPTIDNATLVPSSTPSTVPSVTWAPTVDAPSPTPEPSATELAIPTTTQTSIATEPVLQTATPIITETATYTSTAELTPTLPTQTPTITTTANEQIGSTTALTPTPEQVEITASAVTTTLEASPTVTGTLSTITPTLVTATTTPTVTYTPMLTETPTITPTPSIAIAFEIAPVPQPVFVGQSFELQITPIQTFSAPQTVIEGLCAYNSDMLLLNDTAMLEIGIWQFSIALDEDNAAVLATTTFTALRAGKSAITCVLQATDGTQTLSALAMLEVEISERFAIEGFIFTESGLPSSVTLLNALGERIATQETTNGTFLFNEQSTGSYLVEVMQAGYLPAYAQVELVDASLQVTCELVWGDLNQDSSIDALDMEILQANYSTLDELRLMAIHLSDQSSRCEAER